MNSLPSRLRWPFLGLLACAVVAVPTARGQDSKKATGDDRQQQIRALEKQLADLQKQLTQLKNAEGVVPASATTVSHVEGTIPDDVLKPFNWRCIGPANMGGRITAITAVEADPTTFFIATASGGLLKTINNGTTFDILFDDQPTVSIGDVAVSQSKPDVVWVGSGEANPRNSVSYGDGVYKSTDGGKTWKNMGLKESFQIGKVVIHPKDPDTVYVGALGRLYGANEERGVFKTTDGGKTWDKVLYVDDKTGCIDLRMDPHDPDTLIAAMWERKRDEYDGFFQGDKDAPPDMYGPVVTHGPGGGIYKTADGGKKWTKLTDEKLKNGLPTVKTGRIGLDYARKTKGLLYAVIDTEKVGTGRVPTVRMGITGENAEGGGAKLTGITEDGPAEKAGLKEGDIVIAVDGNKVVNYDTFVDYFQGKNPGDKVKLTVKRGDKEETVEVTLGKRPEGQAQEGARGAGGRGGRGGRGGQVLPPVTGVRFAGEADKLVVEAVTEGGPAAQAGLKEGDVVTAIDGKKVTDAKGYAAELTGKAAGDKVKLTFTRDDKEQTVELTLAPNPRARAGGGGGGGQAGGPTILMPGFVPDFTEDGIKVKSLPAGGAAAKAGLKVGDLIVEVDGQEVTGFRDLLQALRVGQRVEDPRKAGDKVKVKVKQGDKTKEVELALVQTQVPGMFGGGGRGPTPGKPYGLGLGGQQPNRQNSQGKDGYQTGGIYVSKDNGDTWTRVNSLNPRPMYFSQIRVDPNDDKTIYVLCDTPTPMYRSTDGGKTFENLRTARGVHADAHALWIDPTNSRHLIIGCDGGFYATFDKGATWDHLNTLALGQFYHVAVDTNRPYRVYGGLQDNGSWGGPSHTLRRYGPINADWVFVSGGDGFVCRVDATDPDLVYSESQGGNISRRNFRTGERAGIRPGGRGGPGGQGTPRGTEERGGSRPAAPRPRFNWNTPYILSHHNPSIFYSGSQFVYRSVKKGDDLKQISPELTRSPKGSMTALGESPRTPDVLWAGTDDGQLWVTKDAGVNWTNVTDHLLQAGLPGYRWVATVEPSRTRDGRCYVVLDAHRSNDDKPYIFVTDDFGQTFKPLTANLPSFGSTRCLREDIVNPDILYAGTEFGAWVSANRGASWSKLGGNLPTVAVHEFAQPTVANELVAATHGRSVWVLDVNAIRQMKPAVLTAKVTLFTPATAVRWKIGVGGESPYSVTDRKFVGTNPTRGATIEYLLTEKADKVAVKVVDVTGRTVRTFRDPPAGAGLHRLEWNLAGPSQRGQRGGGGGGGRGELIGPQVQPGMYRVVLTVGGKEYAHPLTVELDPNAPRDLIATEIGDDQDEDEEAMEHKEAEEAIKSLRRIDD
ncbi:MAG TPA: PDZ domain-containing protein [Fimbriiglobus sp.]|nr:PDZ domain-containing protein [Fimbriiglobus sp.]